MGEIEFKAKMVDGGVWVYGHYCELAGRKYIIPDYSQFRDIHDADLEDSFTEIIPESVCQFTGLLDENGVKIYEGDMLEFLDGQKSVVRWMHGGLTCQADFGDYDYTNIGWAIEILGGCEIIGNIHDKARQKQVLINMMRMDEELGLYDD